MPRSTATLRTAGRLAAASIGLATLAACGGDTGVTAATAPTSPQGSVAASDVATVGAAAPAGTFSTVDGATVDVASYRGKPTVLWFIATDCSSCTASIPTVADHLNTFRADGVNVAVIDLYGDLGQGPAAARALAQVGHKLAGPRLTDPTWMWGISSRDLSFRYDPYGAPDVYYVIDRAGRITYRNSVPVSTMSDLLAQAKAAA